MKKFNNETEIVFSSEFIGFTTVPNYILNDNRLSYKALGLYCQILQFQNSPNHKIYQSAFIKLKKDGRDSVMGGMKELIDCGYLKKEKLKNEKGQFCGVRYTVFMKPIQKTEVGKSDVGNSDFGKSDTNNKIGEKENLKKENKSPSVFDEISKQEEENKIDGQTDFLNNINIKIKSEKKDELTNLVVEIANDLLINQKSITVSNKKISVSILLKELALLSQEKIENVISYVAKKYEINNNENIKNKNKYIASIFANAVLEKNYALEKFNKQIEFEKERYNKNKFINYNQKEYDYELLKQIERMALEDIDD